MTRPQLWVFAGPNGAGKSTFVDRYVQSRIPVVNPDNIARSLDPALAAAARLALAGRHSVRERADLLASHRSFAIETTLTGHSELDLMRAARLAGYKVNLIYIGLANVQNSVSRVRERAARGGHDVPLADLLRRFDRSLANLPRAMALADRSIVLDNSGQRRRYVHSQDGARTKFTAPTPPGWYVGALSSGGPE